MLHGDVVAGDGATSRPWRAMDRRGHLDLRVILRLSKFVICEIMVGKNPIPFGGPQAHVKPF
jgi:hypothetical protein